MRILDLRIPPATILQKLSSILTFLCSSLSFSVFTYLCLFINIISLSHSLSLPPSYTLNETKTQTLSLWISETFAISPIIRLNVFLFLPYWLTYDCTATDTSFPLLIVYVHKFYTTVRSRIGGWEGGSSQYLPVGPDREESIRIRSKLLKVTDLQSMNPSV